MATSELENEHAGASNSGNAVVGFGSEPSIVDLLKADLQELGEAEEVFVPVVGYERSRLQIKYHLPESGKELDAISRKVMREDKEAYYRNLHIAMDTMIYLCSGVYAQPGDLEKPVPIEAVANSGSPVSFDMDLANLIGIEGGTARQVLRKLFSDNEMAILAHAEKLNRWLQNTKADLTTELWQQLGE